MADYAELVKNLRITEKICRDRMDGQVMLDAADAIEQLQAECQDWYKAYMDLLPTRWYSVEECLPHPGDKVIVAIRDESGDTRFDFTNTGWWSGYGYKFVVEDEFCSWVTHWMPLPTPPKEET